MKNWGVVLVLLAPAMAAAQPPPEPAPPVSEPPEATPPPDATSPPTVPPPPERKPPVPPADLPPPGSAQDPLAVADYDNGLHIRTPDDEFRVGIAGWVMGRWEMYEANSNIDQHFVLPSSRLVISGHAFATIDYVLSTDVASGTPELRDAYIDQPLPKGMIRIGQFKPYFSHQQLMSRSQVTFTERAPTFVFAGIYRDIGAAIHHEPRGRRGGIELAVGIFNGNGTTPQSACTTAPAPDPVTMCTPPTTEVPSGRPLATARIALRSSRADAHRDDDLDHGYARAAFGVGYAVDLAHAQTEEMTHVITADLLVKVHGLSFAAAAFVKNRPGVGGRTNDFAWHAQLGYVLVPHLVELAGRFSQVPVLASDDDLHEAVTALNIYRRAHRLKWQIEGGVLHVTGDSSVDWVVRAQTQVIF